MRKDGKHGDVLTFKCSVSNRHRVFLERNWDLPFVSFQYGVGGGRSIEQQVVLDSVFI